MRRLDHGWTKRSLRLGLLAFFLLLVIPTALLVRQAIGQLKWETFHQYQSQAAELSSRIDGRLIQWVNAEQARSFADYSFLVVDSELQTSVLRRSPLSTLPVEANVPGVIGYFQVDSDGRFTTPALPRDLAGAGLAAPELERRLAMRDQLLSILSGNVLATTDRNRRDASLAGADAEKLEDHAELEMLPMEAVAVEEALSMDADAAAEHPQREQSYSGSFSLQSKDDAEYKQKSLGKVEDLQIASNYVQQEPMATPAPSAQNRQLLEQRAGARKEVSALPGLAASPASADVRLSTFESELDPFEFSRLASGHFILTRKVWRDGARTVQGVLLEPDTFLRGVILDAFDDTSVSQMSDLVVAYRGDVLMVRNAESSRQYLSRADELRGELLYQGRLSAPLSGLELIYSVRHLPIGPGGWVVSWMTAALALVMIGGFVAMYRAGLRQIELARQQRNFVSAVSHELKTPLTSIRMYGEMLREGWAPEDKKQSYYAFIHDESERLSRLISNVLQLARVSRNELQLDLRPVSVGELSDMIASKISSQVERSGFELVVDIQQPDTKVMIDIDAMTQVMINLVDNAIKFSANAEEKRIDISVSPEGRRDVRVSVRDYGPGIPRDQMRKVFRLFYRPESELTRETVGTGIGLALVKQLVSSMRGRVDVVNRNPGAEVFVLLPLHS